MKQMNAFKKVVVGLVASVATSSAINIAWVSDQFVQTGAADTSDTTSTPNGVFGGGTGPYADQGFISLLTTAGHTVTRYNPPDNIALSATDVAQLNTFDLVIIGRSLGSGSFDSSAEALAWNTQVTRPILATNTYLTRSNRLGWFSTSGAPVQPDQVTNPLTFTNISDPVQSYLIGSASLVGSTTVDSITGSFNFPNDGAADVRGISNLTGSTINPGGTIIATSFITATSLTSPFIATLPAGTVLSTTGTGAVAAGQTLGGFRMQFLAGNREAAAAPNNGVRNAGFETLTAEGEQMFLRAVALAANNGLVPIPEPATAALAGLAGLALLRRRR